MISKIILFVFATALAVSATCPPKSVHPVQNFSLESFTAHPWFVQEQMTVIYQQESDLYCTRDTYSMDGDEAVYLKTNWNKGSVDGPRKEVSLHGLIDDLQDPSHLHVGFKYMPRFMRGPYWVVAVESRISPFNHDDPEGGYEWLIVSGGAPMNQSENGKCKLGRLFNNSGLWLFTRLPNPGQQVVDKMRNLLDQMGYDTSVLVKVEHEGCNYDQLELVSQ